MGNNNTGKIIGVFKILSEVEYRANDGHKLYRVQCTKCGTVFTKKLANIKPLKFCPHILQFSRNIKTRYFWSNTRLHNIYKGMKRRCYNPNSKDYKSYGGKGIRICEEWVSNPESFEKWALSSGYNDDLTIDRIDHRGNYCSDNCRWIKLKENTRRAGKVNWITVNGLTLTGRQWAEKLGTGINLVNKYLRIKGEEFTINFIRNKLQDIGD